MEGPVEPASYEWMDACGSQREGWRAGEGAARRPRRKECEKGEGSCPRTPLCMDVWMEIRMYGDQKEESCENGVNVQAFCLKRHGDVRSPQRKGGVCMHACLRDRHSAKTLAGM